MNTSKLVTLIFIIVLFISCGNETIKTVEITPLNMSDAVVHQDGPKNYSYYKNGQRGDLLTFKAVCTTANMVKDKNSNVSWHVEYNGEELHLPLYSDNGKPIFIPNHNELSVFLSNIDTLGAISFIRLSVRVDNAVFCFKPDF